MWAVNGCQTWGAGGRMPGYQEIAHNVLGSVSRGSGWVESEADKVNFTFLCEPSYWSRFFGGYFCERPLTLS